MTMATPGTNGRHGARNGSAFLPIQNNVSLVGWYGVFYTGAM